MRKLAVAILAVIILAVATVVILPSLVPTDRIRDMVVAQVKASTGRDLVIRGKVSVLPSLAVEVADIALSSPPGFSTDLVRLGALRVHLRLLPLLSGRVEVASFVLVDPVLTLEVDRQGRTNWAFASSPEAAPAKAPAAAPAAGAGPADLILGDIRVDNGRVLYVDGRSGERQDLSAISLAMSLPGLDSKLNATGSAQWRGQKIGIEIAAERPRAMVAGGTGPVQVGVTGPATILTLSGQAGASGFDGDLSLTVTAIRDVLNWAGIKPPALGPAALGKVTAKTRLTADADKVALAGLSLVTDATTVEGDATLALGARPRLTATLKAEPLDLAALLPPTAAEPARAQPASGNAQGDAGWSDTPLDLSALTRADADLTLTVARLSLPQAKIDKARLHAVLTKGRLTADVTELALYQGGGQARLTVDASQPSVQVALTAALKGVQAEPALAAAAGFDRLAGTAATNTALTAKGASPRQLVGSLAGKGAVTFTDGAIKGINLAAMARNVTQAFSTTTSNEKTDFSELSGTYTVAAGIVTNKDLKLASPLLRVQGAGTVDLPTRGLNYRVEPKLVASLEGQGGKSDITGLDVPIIVSGPWDALTWRPDLDALVKSKAGQALDQATGGVLGGGTPSGGGQSLLPVNPGTLFGR